MKYAIIYWLIIFGIAGQFDYEEEIKCEMQSESPSNPQYTGDSNPVNVLR